MSNCKSTSATTSKVNTTVENLKEVLSNIWKAVPLLPMEDNRAEIRISRFADLEIFSVDVFHKDGWRSLRRVAIFERKLSLKERQQRRHEISLLAEIRHRISWATDDYGFATSYEDVRVPTRLVEILLNRKIERGAAITCEEVWHKYASWEEGKGVVRTMVYLKGDLNSCASAFFYIGPVPRYEVKYCF